MAEKWNFRFSDTFGNFGDPDTNPEQKITIATDASISPTTKTICAAFVTSTGYCGLRAQRRCTQHVELAELLAVSMALYWISNNAPKTPYTLLTDSESALETISRWRDGQLFLPPNLKFDTLGMAIHQLPIQVSQSHGKFEWVKGHNGHPLNSVVDCLAKYGRRRADTKKASYRMLKQSIENGLSNWHMAVPVISQP